MNGVSHDDGRISVEHFAVGALGCICTIVADRTTHEAIVVDGGDEVGEIVRRLEASGVRATQLVHTHAHVDHIGALGKLRERTGARGLLHPADLPLYALLATQARWLGLREPANVEPPDADLRDGDALTAGRARLDVLHTPGHTPGSCSFALELAGGTLLLTGDTLFAGAVGRWDIGGTSLADIVSSIGANCCSFPMIRSSFPDTGLPRRSARSAALTHTCKPARKRFEGDGRSSPDWAALGARVRPPYDSCGDADAAALSDCGRRSPLRSYDRNPNGSSDLDANHPQFRVGYPRRRRLHS